MVNTGDTFQFFTPEGKLRLVFTVLSISGWTSFSTDNSYAVARVLLIDLTEHMDNWEFRADVGETTDWVFNKRDPERGQLKRVE